MAATAFHAVCHRPSISHRRCSTSTDLLPPAAVAPATALFRFKHSASASLSYSATFAVSPAASASTSQCGVSFDLLEQLLSSRSYREADEETRRLIIVLAGDAAQKRGYVFFSEVKFIEEDDLLKIDGLWARHSDNKFGYSAQKRIWEKCDRDFTRFFVRVGWMKKLEGSEVEQYNYRSFPAEFIWELGSDTPEGHLPLTNALRGTQLLSSILTHPAFRVEEQIAAGEEHSKSLQSPPPMTNFKPNYTF